MKILLKLLFCLHLVMLLSCKSSPRQLHADEYLYSITDTAGPVDRYGYRDSAGNMIVPFGKYSFNYTDTIKSIGFVLASDGSWAIDKQGEKLFQTYPSPNNGPDEVNEGLFRILGADGTIGFADMEGNIVVSPRFSATSIFSDGKATFCQGCPLAMYKIVQTEGFRQVMLKLRNEMPDIFFIISGRKYGRINLKGDTILRPIYERIFPTRDGITMVLKDGNAFYIDSVGNEVDYDPLKHPSQKPIQRDVTKCTIYFKNEEELLKFSKSL